MADNNLQKQLDDLVAKIKKSLRGQPKEVVGIDIGSRSVKIAQVKPLKNERYKLIRYAEEILPEGAIIEDEIQKEPEIIHAIQNCLKRMGLGRVSACIGVSGRNTFARKLQLAGGSQQEIEDQLTWEIEQYVPFDIDDAAIGFHIVGENAGGGVDVIVAVSKKNVRDNFKELVEKNDTPVVVVDTNITAMINVFEQMIPEEEKTWIVLDFGAQKTIFVIYSNNAIVFSKEIAIGGSTITEEIQRQLGLNFQDAENLKINGDQDGNLPEEIVTIIDKMLDTFYQDVKKTMDFYITSTSDESITTCFVTGGSCLIPDFQAGLSSVLGIEVKRLNPFDVIELDDSKITEDSEILGYFATVAIGLAIRATDK